MTSLPSPRTPGAEPPRPRPTVLYQRLPDGSAVLVDAASGNAYAVNATAAEVWELCDGRRSPAAIVAALLDRYEAAPAEVEAGVAAVLAHFRELGALDEQRATMHDA